MVSELVRYGPHRPDRPAPLRRAVSVTTLLDRREAKVEQDPWSDSYSLLAGVRRMGGGSDRCQICNARLGLRTCSCCGRDVCSSCYVEVLHYCEECTNSPG